MLIDSREKNLERPANDIKNPASGLNKNTIEIISKCNPGQLKMMYERYSTRYLMREISAWEKLGKHNVAGVIKNIIEGRRTSA